MRLGLLFLALLVAMTLAGTVAPVTAQSGLSVELSSQCIEASPGSTVSLLATASLPSTPTAPVPISFAVVGSTPKDSNITVSPAVGSLEGTPLTANVTIHIADQAGTVGSYQVGIVVRAGADYRIVLFALHVNPAGSPASECSRIGLPLPDSTFLVTATSLGLGLLTQLVTRRFVDLGKERKMKAEVAAFNREKKEAALANDKAKVERLKKRELTMRQAQSKVQLARTKVTFITIVPLFLVYYLMATFLGGYGAIVAVSPIPLPYLVGPNGEMVLIWWYIIGSFTLSSILSKLLHTTT